MKKKKILFTCLLLFIIAIPLSITFGSFDGSAFINFKNLFASTSTESGYDYDNVEFTAQQIYGSGTIPEFRVGTGSKSKHYASSRVFFHEASKDGKHYWGYCLHVGQSANIIDKNNNPTTLTAHIYTDNFGDDVKNNSDESLSANQKELLQELLASAQNFNPNNSRSIDSLTVDEAKYMYVVQVMIWEIVEGSRTSWSVKPDYLGNDSSYILIAPRFGTTYNDLIGGAANYHSQKSASSSANGQTYTLDWNANTKKYTTTVSGLNGFGGCTSSDSKKVSVSTNSSNNTATVTTTEPNINAKIKCYLTRGSGSSEWTYYTFDNPPFPGKKWQDIIRGFAGSKHEISFTVKTSPVNVSVLKRSETGERLPNVKFALSMSGESDISLKADGTAEKLHKTGTYILKEDKTTIPHGYDAIDNVEISFDISKKVVTACAGKALDSNGCCRGIKDSIKIGYNSTSNTFEITVTDNLKDFKIAKIDGATNSAVKGATFNIYKGNEIIKFSKQGNVFTYDTSGSADVVDASNSIYSIRLLPTGIYRIVETNVPGTYVRPKNISDATIYIKVEDGYVIRDCGSDSSCKNAAVSRIATITFKNYNTKVDIQKQGTGAKPLPGVHFVLLKSDKTTYVNAEKQNNGQYDYKNNSSSTTTDATNATVYITDSKGNIRVNYLPEGKYYFKEIATVDPYVLPEGDDVYTEITIEMRADGPYVNNHKSLFTNTSPDEFVSNATKEFSFYKVDEDGNYLSGGKFKLQKFNDKTGKYEDVCVKSVKNDGTYQEAADVFKEDDGKDCKVQFTLAHGIATFIDMAAGTTYRVVEIEAPKGYTVADIEGSAVIKIDKNGYAKGSATIINQSQKLEGSTAQAELIIEIQTGQTVMKYGYIITGTLIVIFGLMFALIYISKKRK